EEMRVANAPTRRFFVADRQSGPILIKYAPEHIKMDILPRICKGEICFAIGMSEPNSGSDLFAAKTRATKTDGGYLINGTKIWTSSAHIADYMIAIFRTSPPTKENRRHGLTQFLVKMKQPGIQVNPIGQITGQCEFNEVVFTDHFIPEDHMLGEIDGAWKQATTELAYERSGPERFLETYYVLTELVRALGPKPDTRAAEGVGRLVAQLHTMRRMSVSVAGMLEAGKEPAAEASIVKDIGVTKSANFVGTIEIQRPPHNFFDMLLIQQIATAMEEFDNDDSVRAVVLCAQGKSFCAGANFNDPQRQESVSNVGGSPTNHLYQEAVRLLRTKKPIVAAVHGAAIGGGLGVACAADFRVTCPEARFAANFTKLGFHPGFGLTVLLTELVGKNQAELLFY